VVIGAGVLGAAVAASLTRRGADVTVLEARGPGAGTTGTSFAWVNANNKDPQPYFALNHAGVRAHHELAKGGAPWFFPTGNLEWAVTEERRAALATRVETLRARDYPVQWLTARQAHALEPDLAEQPADAEYAFFPEEAHTWPAVLLARLLGEARQRGARVVSRAEVTELDRGHEGVLVRLADGNRHAADIVVSCVGRWTSQVAGLAGVTVPMLDPDLPGSATVGFLATTNSLPVRLSRVLTTPKLNIRPDGAGRLLLQALDLDAAADPAVPVAPGSDIADAIVSRLPEVFPAASATLDMVRVGQRSMPADGLTVAGFADAGERFYVVATHSGITLAPLLGELVAEETHGNQSSLLAPFRPDRFLGVISSPPPPARGPGEQ
jgi:glycine/D-amino acid oxidase-like deaminating enzyme